MYCYLLDLSCGWTVLHTMLSFSLDARFGSTLESAVMQKIWMEARVEMHQANKTELNCFVCFLNIEFKKANNQAAFSREVKHRNVSVLAVHQWSLQSISLQRKQWVRCSVLWHSDFSPVISVGLHWTAEVWRSCLRNLTPLFTAQSALFDLNLNDVKTWKQSTSRLFEVVNNCLVLLCSDSVLFNICLCSVRKVGRMFFLATVLLFGKIIHGFCNVNRGHFSNICVFHDECVSGVDD